VGSSINLSLRIKNYFNISYLKTEIKKNKSMIYKALLKNGYSKFSLERIEYCDLADLIKREQYYIDLLKPEYNILKIAGSRLGSIHTIESRAKISSSKAGEANPMFGKKRELHPMFGKKHLDETLKKMSEKRLGKPRPEGSGRPSQKIEVIDIKNNTITLYDSMAAAAIALDIKREIISQFFSKNQKKPYKKRYFFRKI